MTGWVEFCKVDDISQEDVIRFDYCTGETKGAPVCVNLRTYPVRIDGAKVLIDLG